MTTFGKSDSVWVGIVVGIIVPIVVYGILLTIYTLLESMGLFSDFGFAEDFRVRTLILFSICANLVAMQRYRKSYRNETMRGILITSMLLVVTWFFVFGIKIMKG